MQAMTLSIGQAGINFFAQNLVGTQLQTLLGGLKPQDNTISVPNFNTFGFGYSCSYSNISVNLTNGSLIGFVPQYTGVQQTAAGTPAGSQFTLNLQASNFTAQYKWSEAADEYCCYTGGGEFPACNSDHDTGSWTYSPQIGQLAVVITTAFQYQASSNTWTITTVGNSTATSTNVTPNIPGQSVIQNQDTHCFSSNVSDATAQSIATIDFSTPINQVIPPLLKSIPASGDLGSGIVFDWSLGDSGLTFPNCNGISIGVAGRVSYNGTYFEGQAAPTLPVPPVPANTDTHHLQTYVSDYEINALQWAFFKAGKLNTTATPGTIPDPNALKVKTYVSWVSALKPYAACNMQADIQPLSAPTAVFQQVWMMSQTNIDNLKPQLPSNVWSILNNNLGGNSYVNVAALTQDLGLFGVDSSFYTTIENATSAMGMVANHNIQMKLTILDGSANQPNIIFSVVRQDILSNLGLGIAGTAQTMQYQFVEVSSSATFVSSTIPNFPGSQMEGIWATAGDPQYDTVLSLMGQTGVPLPIMSGFQFLFNQATLSVQQGYVSIVANVQFKGMQAVQTLLRAA